jgi:hypothetical protein
MIRQRWRLLLAIGGISFVLAFFLRDVMYEAVIVPLAYILWLLKFYYSALPQWLLWTLLIAALFFALLWNLLPESKPRRRREQTRRLIEGQVESLATWIAKSRHGNYFKWQLANRLGRIARGLDDSASSSALVPSGDEAVDRYLDAGLNYSFVDFPSRGNRFQRAPRTPLDLDPSKVADYLESRMENTSGRR